MRADPIWAWVAGGWRTARKPFACDHCDIVVRAGVEYYDTGDKNGSHYWQSVKVCLECAEARRKPNGTLLSEAIKWPCVCGHPLGRHELGSPERCKVCGCRCFERQHVTPTAG